MADAPLDLLGANRSGLISNVTGHGLLTTITFNTSIWSNSSVLYLLNATTDPAVNTIRQHTWSYENECIFPISGQYGVGSFFSWNISSKDFVH